MCTTNSLSRPVIIIKSLGEQDLFSRGWGGGLTSQKNLIRNITWYSAKETQFNFRDLISYTAMLPSANTACPLDIGYSVGFTTVLV